VARRHVLGKGGVPVVGAAASMRRDPLTLEEDFDGLRRKPHLDLAARKAVRDTIKVSVDLDVVIDADATQAPFGKSNRAGRAAALDGADRVLRARRGGVTPSRRSGRSSLSCRSNSPIAALSSARL
jgi:hypothetical protein